MCDEEPPPTDISPKEEQINCKSHHVPGFIFEDFFVVPILLIFDGVLRQLLPSNDAMRHKRMTIITEKVVKLRLFEVVGCLGDPLVVSADGFCEGLLLLNFISTTTTNYQLRRYMFGI